MEKLPSFEQSNSTNQEQLENVEQGIEKTPVIRLEFFRHDAKEKETTSGPRLDDEKVRLTPEGRVHAQEVGVDKNPSPATGLVYGSTRERSVETAYHQMFATEEGISPSNSLEDVRAKIGQELSVGSKEIMTPLLDFNLDGTQQMHDEAYRHYLETKDGLVFMLEESDNLAVEAKDATSTVYSRAAANIAELVKKYIQVLAAWERINEKDQEKYEESGHELQRFLGSHATYVECFLLKVVEIVEGRDEAKALIQENAIQNGFNFSEGYTLNIERNRTGSVDIKVGYKDRSYTITPEILDEIVWQREQLNLAIASKEDDEK